MSTNSLPISDMNAMKSIIIYQISEAKNLADCRITLYNISDKFKPRLNEYVDAKMIPFNEAHKHTQELITALHNKSRYIFKSPQFNN